MSERTLRRILSAVGALVVAWLIVTVVRAPDVGDGGSGGGVSDLLAGLDSESVEEVRVEGPDGEIRLSRTDGGWSVNGFPADSSRVAAFWADVAEARVTGPVARNPSNHPRLGVSADGAARMTFRSADGEERALLVGESGPSRPSAYVRLPDSDPVHLVHADLGAAVARGVEGWRDRTVVRLDTARIRTLVFARPEGEVTLVRGEGGWRLADGAATDAPTVRGLLGSLAGLRATGFAPDTLTMDAADRTLVALGDGADTVAVLSLADMEPAGAYVRARRSPTIYELTSYQVGRLFPEPEGLRGESGDGS